jgi:hypothetical protein
VAIIWGIFPPIPQDLEKNYKDNLLQFAKIGIKLIKEISSDSARLG